jgi:predicted restriction endonuclease
MIDIELSKLLGARDKTAKYYKPLCVFSVCELLNDGLLDEKGIEVIPVLDRFDDLIRPIIPNAVGKGFQPFWHLGTPKFWKLYSAARTEVKAADFKSRKPKTRKQLESEVSYAVPSKAVGSLLKNAEYRTTLMFKLVHLLEEESDDSSAVIAAVLKNRLDDRLLGERRPLEFFEEFDEVSHLATEDYRRLRIHRTIDRVHSKKVKALHGFVCALCSVNLEDVYGEVGKAYIEAHHLNPVSENAGRRVTLDLKKDYVVLCANCHRMVHRAKLPHSLEAYIEKHGRPRFEGIHDA